jgi:uncharacterized protein YjbI with pentapeptide repeats
MKQKINKSLFLLFILGLVSGYSFADSPPDCYKLLDDNVNWSGCQGKRLYEGYNAKNGKFIRTVFEDETNFHNVHMEGADFTDARLQGAYLNSYADGAIFEHADLTNAYFASGSNNGAQFRAVNFKRSILKNADLYKAYIENSDFTDANLQDSKLERSYANKTKFINANLENAYLYKAHIEGANFTGATLTAADLRYANGDGTIFNDAHLEKVKFYESSFKDAKFKNANLEHAELNDVRLANADFTGAHLNKAHIEGLFGGGGKITFEDADLTGATFYATNELESANFKRANLTGAKLCGVYLLISDFTDATWIDGSKCSNKSCDDRATNLLKHRQCN